MLLHSYELTNLATWVEQALLLPWAQVLEFVETALLNLLANE